MERKIIYLSLIFITTVFLKYPVLKDRQVAVGDARAADKLPNIILLMADDMGWGDVGFNGNPVIRTPELDKMAAHSIQFERFYAGSAICSPTRGSVLTGRNPERYGIFWANVGHLKREEFTLAEALKLKGYVTGHFGKWHLGTMTNSFLDGKRGGRDTVDYSPPWENGFDFCFSTEQSVPTWDPMKDQPVETKYWTGKDKYATENLEGDDSKIIMDRVLPFIKNAGNKKKPFFAVVWFHAPHKPVRSGGKFLQLYKNLSEDKQHYYGCISAMDEQVGRLRHELRKMKIEDNTILFFTSDNGPAGKGGGVAQFPGGRQQGSSGMFRGRKGSLYEGGIREPGLMEWPAGISAYRKVYVPVVTSDYFPTILGLAGFNDKTGPRPLDGMSILPVINNDIKNRNSAIPFKLREQRALIDDQYKLYSADDGNSYELYDLLNDPYENHNLSEKFPEKVAAMSKMLKEWISSTEDSRKGADYNR